MDWKIIRSKKVWLSVAAAIVMSAFCFLADMQQEGVAAAADVKLQADSSGEVRGADAGTGEEQTGESSFLSPWTVAQPRRAGSRVLAGRFVLVCRSIMTMGAQSRTDGSAIIIWARTACW